MEGLVPLKKSYGHLPVRKERKAARQGRRDWSGWPEPQESFLLFRPILPQLLRSQHSFHELTLKMCVMAPGTDQEQQRGPAERERVSVCTGGVIGHPGDM